MNMGENDEDILFITKSEFIRRVQLLNKGLYDLGLRYSNLLLRTRTPEKKVWVQKILEGLSDDINANNELIARAEIETGYNVFCLNSAGNIFARRCSSEEYAAIYRRKLSSQYIY